MKVICFSGNLGNQIFYCAFKDKLIELKANEKVYFYHMPGCPKVSVQKFFVLELPKESIFVNILSFVVFYLDIVLRKLIHCGLPKWLISSQHDSLDVNSIFFSHYLQEKFYYQDKKSDWLKLKLPEQGNLSSEYFSFLRMIEECNSVCVHVRRGDYVKPGSAYVDLSSTDYYQKAMDYAKTILPDAKFFFFSDDLNFVRETFKGDNITYVDCNRGKNGYLDIQLMSMAKMNIMANSTFSYWAAYMNNEKKTVIYPKQWFCEWTGRKAPNIMLEKDNWIGL